MSLKTKITSQDEFDALSDDLREHYRKTGAGEYVLVTDGAEELRTALDRERGNARRSSDLLTRLVPGLTDDNGKLRKYDEWEGVVEPVEDLLRVLRDHGEDFDGPAGLREALARGEGGDTDKEVAELRGELAKAREDAAKIRSERDKATREATRAGEKAELLTKKARQSLLHDRLESSLEQHGFTNKTARAAAAALIRDKYNLDVENLDVDGVDPQPVARLGEDDVRPLNDWLGEWAKGEEGSELRKAFNVGPEGGTEAGAGGGGRGSGGGEGGGDKPSKPGPDALRHARQAAREGASA